MGRQGIVVAPPKMKYWTINNNRLTEMVYKVRYWIGVPLVLSVSALIIYRIYTNWTTLKPVISQIKVDLALGGIGILSIAITLLSWNWVSILSFRETHVHRLNCMRAYFLTNLTRYIPGGVWHFAGRTLWLIHQGHNPHSVAESLVFEQGMTLTAAIAVGFMFLDVINWRPLTAGIAVFSVLLLALLAAFAVTAPKTAGKGLQLRFLERWFILIVGYVLFWVLYGLSTICFATAIVGERITDFGYIRLIGQSALSWAIGYVIFFVPGGWGVRELAFMHLLSRDFSGSIIFILPVLSRLAQILAELLCGGVFSLLWQLNSLMKVSKLP
ncbi:hypothetical protein [Thermanaerothrix sp.]|uniref:hypothetical protein n=1 Tax=Thermanaerothrix sp. TaxID=2972675 RepID=UPI003C7DBFDC